MTAGTEALLVLPRPTLHLVAVRVRRSWISSKGTERVEVDGFQRTGFPFRRHASFDARQLLPLSALENLSTAAPAEKSASQKKAGAGAA